MATSCYQIQIGRIHALKIFSKNQHNYLIVQAIVHIRNRHAFSWHIMTRQFPSPIAVMADNIWQLHAKLKVILNSPLLELLLLKIWLDDPPSVVVSSMKTVCTISLPAQRPSPPKQLGFVAGQITWRCSRGKCLIRICFLIGKERKLQIHSDWGKIIIYQHKKNVGSLLDICVIIVWHFYINVMLEDLRRSWKTFKINMSKTTFLGKFIEFVFEILIVELVDSIKDQYIFDPYDKRDIHNV